MFLKDELLMVVCVGEYIGDFWCINVGFKIVFNKGKLEFSI